MTFTGFGSYHKVSYDYDEYIATVCLTCEQALYGAAEDLYGSCGGGSGRKGPRHALSFFLETDILKSHNDLFE